jgi:hypothetical protein
MTRIDFEPGADRTVVSTHTLALLQELGTDAGVSTIRISSTQRTPTAQARAMFNNIRATSVKRQRALYGPNGDAVIDVYVEAQHAGKPDAEIVLAMIAKINDLGPSKVSAHCADPRRKNVVDVRTLYMTAAEQARFIEAVKKAEADGRVSKFLYPPADPAFHIEIPQQPQEAAR